MYLENAIFFQTTSINLEVALYPYPALDPDSRQSFYSKNAGVNISFKPPKKSIYTLLSQSNLIVTSVPNTVFYQALLSNYPVVIWFAPGVEIDDSFNKLFEELEKCSVFHRTAVSCANFLNEVNLDQWWSSKIVQANIKRLREALLGC